MSKLSLLAKAVDDAFALPGSYGALTVARRAWREYKAEAERAEAELADIKCDVDDVHVYDSPMGAGRGIEGIPTPPEKR